MSSVGGVFVTKFYGLENLFKTCYSSITENGNLLTPFYEWGFPIPRIYIREGNMNTYVKLYRSLLDHEMLSEDNTAFIVFTKILLRADWKTGKLVTGRFKLASLTNLKPMTAWDALHRLQTVRVVRLETVSNKTTIHICNWHKYQSETVNKPSENFDDDRQQTVTNNKNKRIKNIYKAPMEPVENFETKQSPEINEMFQYWNDTIGLPIVSKQKANRYACNNLLKKYGSDGVRRLVRGVKRSMSDQYAPRISDFSQLQSRLNEFMVWAKKLDKPATSIGGTAKPSGQFDHLKNLSRRELNKIG